MGTCIVNPFTSDPSELAMRAASGFVLYRLSMPGGMKLEGGSFEKW